MNQSETENHIGALTGAQVFQGYAPPTSSTTYTPNQFFDVVLPRASRGCLRLVAYLIRKTLGWSDEQGNPQNPEATVTYRELIERAGIGRGRIKEAIEEAIESRYINCLRFGQPHKAGEEGFSALYSLRWDERENYITDATNFDGFFAGNGNLTHIPNDFFDYTIPTEPLALVKVVGVIIRNTIGFQTKYGFRRQQVEMSFSEIMRRAGIASRSTMSIAIKEALDKNHVCKVSEGFFDRNAGNDSHAATYGIKWVEASQSEPKSNNGSKIEPGNRFRNRTGNLPTVPKSNRGMSPEIEPANGSIIELATVPESNREGFQNRTDIKTTQENNIPKQQQTEGVAVAGGKSLALLMGRLLGEGIDSARAAKLVEDFPAERIAMQLDALPFRKVKSSKTGFLIRAIELDIPISEAMKAPDSAPKMMAAHFYAELGGNQGEPIPVVASADEDAATSLLSLFPPALRGVPEKLGREFARFTLKQNANSKFPVRTLSLAVRSFGNEFLSSRRIKLESESKLKLVERKAAHEKEFAGDFKEYLRSIARAVEAEAGPIWTECESWIEKKIARRKQMSDTIYRRSQEQLAEPNGRCDFILDFLSESYAEMVPSFWTWDATMNEKPFSTEGISE